MGGIKEEEITTIQFPWEPVIPEWDKCFGFSNDFTSSWDVLVGNVFGCTVSKLVNPIDWVIKQRSIIDPMRQKMFENKQKLWAQKKSIKIDGSILDAEDNEGN